MGCMGPEAAWLNSDPEAPDLLSCQASAIICKSCALARSRENNVLCLGEANIALIIVENKI